MDTIKTYDEMLKKHITNKDYIRFNRYVKEGEANISGYLLKMSKNFLLIQKEEEFYLNGYAIIPKNEFHSIRHNKFDKTFNKILQSEGIIKEQLGIKNSINLDSWKTIFTDLKTFNYNVIVECEYLESPSFTIGPIKRVTDKYVSIQHFDATGTLDMKSTTIYYEDITITKFDDRYINVFKKYLK